MVLALVLAAAGCGSSDRPAGPTDESASTGSVVPSSTPRPPVSSPPVPPAAPRGPEIDRLLIEAAARGDTAQARRLLSAGASPLASDDRGATALVRAAYGDHVDTAGVLIGAGADVNAEDDTQQSAYLIATSEVGDDPRLLELTLRGGADINAKDRFNGTGLIRAAERGHARIVEVLLRAGIDRDHINRLGYTALHEAIIFGAGDQAHSATVEALIRGGVDVNIPANGVSPLALAEQRGQQRIASILRAAGAQR